MFTPLCYIDVKTHDLGMPQVEEGVEKLRALFPDTTIVAALDLVDRDNGTCR